MLLRPGISQEGLIIFVIAKTLLFMNKKKSKQHIIKLFPQPVYATKLSLMTLYELICYIIIFVFFGFLFFKFHKVPVRDFVITAERIDDNRDYYAQSSNLNVEWIFPMSSIVSDTENGQCYMTCSRVEDSIFHIITASNRLIDGNKLYDKDEKYSYLVNNMETVNDNWQTLPAYYTSITCSSEDFYVRHANRYSNKGINNVSNLEYEKTGLFIDNLKAELYFAGKKAKLTHEMAGKYSNAPYSRPKLYSLFDISQSYFRCRVKTHTIDKIRLAFYFEGATEVDDVKFAADTIFGSSVIYNIKNVDETDSEILIYARFKDLENMQSLRLFVVSSLIGGLIMVFVGFLVIYLYRVVRQVRDDRPLNERTPEEEDDDDTEIVQESDNQES